MRHRSFVGTLAAAGIALAVTGFVLSNATVELQARARKAGRDEISRMMPKTDALPLSGKAKEKAIALEKALISQALPAHYRLSREKLALAYNDSMQVIYIRKNGDTAFSYEISSAKQNAEPLVLMVQRALGSALGIPCEEQCDEPGGRRQTVPYASWAAFVRGNVRNLVFDERHKPDSIVWARYPDVVTNPSVWARNDWLAFAGVMVHEAGHNYATTLGISRINSRENERLAAGFFYSYLKAAALYLPDSMQKPLAGNGREEAMYVVSKASQESIADDISRALGDEKAAPYKKAESAAGWLVIAGMLAAVLALVEKYTFALSRALGRKE